VSFLEFPRVSNRYRGRGLQTDLQAAGERNTGVQLLLFFDKISRVDCWFLPHLLFYGINRLRIAPYATRPIGRFSKLNTKHLGIAFDHEFQAEVLTYSLPPRITPACEARRVEGGGKQCVSERARIASWK
jgi:hypothetical protein